MKAYYNPEGDPCWIDTLVEIVAWDGDWWYYYPNKTNTSSKTLNNWVMSN